MLTYISKFVVVESAESRVRVNRASTRRTRILIPKKLICVTTMTRKTRNRLSRVSMGTTMLIAQRSSARGQRRQGCMAEAGLQKRRARLHKHSLVVTWRLLQNTRTRFVIPRLRKNKNRESSDRWSCWPGSTLPSSFHLMSTFSSRFESPSTVRQETWPV